MRHLPSRRSRPAVGPPYDCSMQASTGVRFAELMAALSVATDFAMGQPVEHALASCALAVRLGEGAGLSVHELRDV